MDVGLTAIILCIVFFSILIRSTFGFGDALVAMPLLALFIDVKLATPLMALIAFFTSMAILVKNWQKVEYKSIWPLVIFSLLGIPIGLWYLDDINEYVVKAVLGFIVFIFSIYSLLKPRLVKLNSNRFAWMFGLAAGILGGAYNTNGPPIVIYSALKRWNPQNFRATMQGYFFMSGILIVFGHSFAGNVTREVLFNFIYCLPVIIIAIILGKYFNKRMATEQFHKYIYILLVLIGSMLIYSALRNIL